MVNSVILGRKVSFLDLRIIKFLNNCRIFSKIRTNDYFFDFEHFCLNLRRGALALPECI